MPPAFKGRSPLTLAIAASLFAVPAARAGKETPTSARHSATAPKAPDRESGEEPLAAGEIKVRAESYEQTAKGHVEARGLVDLRVADVRVQADQADVFEEPQPGGGTRRRIVAQGNVVFIRGQERLSGDRLEMDDTGKGVLDNAVGYLVSGVFVEARRIERLDADRYRVEGGTFTSCSQPNPRWEFTASRASVHVDDKITGTNALFKVKSVPVFYTPYIYYPISKSHRSTGFLLPSLGYTEARGFNLTTGFFWAMGRSADQTLTLDYYSKSGYGLGHEFRWVGSGSSRWTLHSVAYDLKNSSKYDYSIDWHVLQQLPGKLRLSAYVNRSSNLFFLQQYTTDFARMSSRTQNWSASIERSVGIGVLSASGQLTDVDFGTGSGLVNERAPSLTLRGVPRQLPGGVVFAVSGSADRIRYGTRPVVNTWTRYDIGPSLSRPLHVSFLDFNPSLSYRYTRYGERTVLDEEGNPTLDENGDVVKNPAIERSFWEASLSMTGPTFARVFDTPGFGYSPRFKHTIGPEVTWTYRTAVKPEDYEAIPKMDGQDWAAGTNQINYALVQRFYAKRRSASGKTVPYQFFSWRLGQGYYVQINQGQSNFDPNYSSSFYGPQYRPEHLGPLQSRMTLRPTPEYSVDYQLEYDVNFRQTRRMSVSANAMRPGFGLQATWSRSLLVSDDPSKRGIGGDSLRAGSSFDLFQSRLHLEGSAEYDLLKKTLWQMRASLHYSVQCCGFTVEHVRYNWSGQADKQWRFAIELANVGSLGTSTGADLTGGRFGMGGF